MEESQSVKPSLRFVAKILHMAGPVSVQATIPLWLNAALSIIGISSLKSALLIVCGMAMIVSGCDTSERIARVEKQNKQLQEEMSKRNAVADYDLQARCSNDAKVWFQENWQREHDPTTLLLDYKNHYNKAMNKCFVFVEYHYTLAKGTSSWTNLMSLWDVYENLQFGDFGENHMIRSEPRFENSDVVVTCQLAGTKCKSVQEFNNLVRPYMSD